MLSRWVWFGAARRSGASCGRRHVHQGHQSAAKTNQRAYVARRALMYIPGSDQRKIAKIPQIGADCVCLDCEDGVAVGKKEEARINIRQLLKDNSRQFFGRSEVTVRLNSMDSGLCDLDLATIFKGMAGDEQLMVPSAVHLPKVDRPEQLREFARMFRHASGLEPETHPHVSIGLIIFIESACALINLVDICRTATELQDSSVLVPEALVFGSDDYVADIGATRTKSALELLYARQKLVTVAKAFGMQAIDLVHIDYKDTEGLRQQCIEGSRMGFTGKQVIHPSQVPVVQAEFSPSLEKIDWATSLIREFREHEAKGKGAFTFRGHMIDMPLVKQAQNIVNLQHQINPPDL